MVTIREFYLVVYLSTRINEPRPVLAFHCIAAHRRATIPTPIAALGTSRRHLGHTDIDKLENKFK
ncbi:hypothetical protein ANO14919_109200 [Xylariales sp. No.14919]|nr:hypothetical protein ANO14919_109200 [Xylariales sp. No.14919]